MHFERGKLASERREIALPQRVFVDGAFLARIREMAPGQAQDWIVAQRLAKNRNSAGLHNPSQLGGGDSQIEMVQDGVAPDTAKAAVRERESRALGLHALDGDAVGARDGKCPAR